MRGTRARIAGIVVLATLLAPPASAMAATPPAAPVLFARAMQMRDELALLGQNASSRLGPLDRRTLSELKFTNRDGYTITVVGFGQTVALSVSRDHGHQDRRGVKRSSTTTYLAHGKVTPTSIQASFADRGRIAVRFRPAPRPLRAGRNAGCKRSSDGLLGRLGVFVGELRFRGENGYTSAEVHRVHGGTVDFRALIACLLGKARPGRRALLSGVSTHPSHRPKRTTLIADRKTPLSRTVFGAQLRGEGRVRFIALEESSEGSLGMIRIVTASGAPAAFAFDDHLSGATVAPPAPFSGSGAFQHGAGSEKSWAGPLAVSFLGAPGTPLTGSPFKTQLVQSW
jgi:hypothetical protein